MNKIKSGFRFMKIVFVLSLAGCGVITNKHVADQHFLDPKVIALCNAAKAGDKEKIDQLLLDGVNINSIGKAGLNPIFWLLVHNEENEDKKIGFRHLLKNGANVLQIYTPTDEPLLHVIASYVDSDYLQMTLEEQPDIDIDFETDSSWNTTLLQAESSNRFKNFKLLLDHGADIEKQNDRGDTPIDMASGNGSWQFAYELLKRGADYKGGPVNLISGEINEKPKVIWKLENNIYNPFVSINYRGTDYRQKVVEFLRAKGVEVHPWMPEDEEYRYENGIAQLYIKEENGEWVKFEESSRYNPNNHETRKDDFLKIKDIILDLMKNFL